MKNCYYLIFLVVFFLSCKSPSSEKAVTINKEYLESRILQLSEKMEMYLDQIPIDSLHIPRSLSGDGDLIAKNSRQWTSGFFPGTLWQLASVSKSDKIKDAASQWTAFIEKEKWDTHTHDLGFKLNSSFGQKDKVMPSAKNKEIIIQTAKTLIKRFNPTVGAIKSWDKDSWQYPVIIDNMMNLEILFDATQFSGDSIYYNMAHEHAKTTIKSHFRSNYSSYHVIDFDTLTGQIIGKQTHQGLNDESAWSRGQAWGLYGFAMAHDRTKDIAFFDQATSIADFFFNHPNLPEDMIPYWDFDADSSKEQPRDVSAAVIAAGGLMKLAKHDSLNKDKYLKWVDTILVSLNTKAYQSDKAPFLLDHSTGSVPGKFEVDVPITYGDYYYVEALIARMQFL